ncbi:hypothetical protein JB92DRAFT_1848323 [Gautieria morchelliformis]|nr:hypothetical protein JB92DRAFT_1848323 [Gautieria morchelliformis]
MAEALAGLAVAASVIAVVRTTEDVITKCSAYRIAYRNASKDMTRLSDQVSGLQGVLLDLHKLTVAEESQTFSRLPTLMTALEISHGDQTTGGIPEVRKSEDDARPGYGLTESMPSERTGLIKRLLKNFKRHGGKNMIDSQCERPDGIPSPNATTGDSLTAEGENTAGNASEIKDDHMNLPRVLRDCHVQLQSLSKKLETKIVRASRKEALVYAFKQGEVNKILDSLLKFQQQLVVALSIDQACVQIPTLDGQ